MSMLKKSLIAAAVATLFSTAAMAAQAAPTPNASGTNATQLANAAGKHPVKNHTRHTTKNHGKAKKHAAKK